MKKKKRPTDTDDKIRIQQARGTFIVLGNLWKSQEIKYGNRMATGDDKI